MMLGVRFDDIHSEKDLGLILNKKIISPPSPQTKKVKVPMRNGTIDLTELLSGDVKYDDRKINMTFTMMGDRRYWPTRISAIENIVNGKKFRIIFDDDESWYYLGRVDVTGWNTDNAVGTIDIEATTDPFKYDIQTTAEEWLWDPFNFETGLANEVVNMVVEGELEKTIIGRRKKVTPEITVSEDMVVIYKGNSYNLHAGYNKIFEILIVEGENTLKFIGNGVVTVNFTGGSL